MFTIPYLSFGEWILQTPTGWVLKSLLLLLAVLIAERVVRSAALAHRVWLIAMFGFLLIPIVSYLFPAITIRIPVRVASAVSTSSEIKDDATSTPIFVEPISAADSVAQDVQVAWPDEGAFGNENPRDSKGIVQQQAIGESEDSIESIEVHSDGAVDWSRWIFGIWAVGCGVFLLRIAVALYGLNRQMSSKQVVADRLEREIQAMCRRIGVNSGIRLYYGESGSVPMVWWWGGWNLMLPSDFDSWPEERRRIVVAHELGHVARRDAISDLVTQIVCSIGWFHPFIWLAARRIQQLREDACDDVVLRHFEPDLYAKQLVDVVSECLPFRARLGCPMVRRSNLERRVRMILAGGSFDAFPNTLKAACILGVGLAFTFSICIASVVADVSERSNRPEQKQSSEQTDEATHDEKGDRTEFVEFVSASGIVKDPAGKPMAGVKLQLRVNLNGTYHASSLDTDDLLAEVTSRKDGSFEFDRVGIPLNQKDVVRKMTYDNPNAIQILAKHDQFGLSWHSLSALEESDIQLLLHPQGDLNGTIVDENSNSIANATLRITGIFPREKAMRNIPDGKRSVDLFYSSVNPRATTDESGSFKITGLPMGHRVSFAVTHPGYSSEHGVAAVGENLRAQKFTVISETQREYVSPMRMTLKAGPKFVLRLPKWSDDDNWFVSVSGPQSHMPGLRANGEIFRATVKGPGEWFVRVMNSKMSFGRSILLTEKHAQKPLDVAIDLPRPRVLSGTVSNRNGQPIERAMLVWAREKAETHFSARTITDSEGRFQLSVLPGKGTLAFDGTSPSGFLISSHTVPRDEAKKYAREVTISATEELKPLEIEVPAGLVVTGRLLDANQQPVANTKVTAYSGGRYAPYSHNTKTDDEGKYRFAGLHPRQVYFLYSNGDAGVASATISGDDDHPFDEDRIVSVDMSQEPAVTLLGRVLKNGQPVSQVRLKLRRGMRLPNRDGTRYVDVSEATSDDEGYYRLPGLKRGDRYQVEVNAPFQATAPGWRHQNPYVVSVPASAEAEFVLDDMHLSSLGQTISGRVVDPSGNPIENASVSASLRDGRRISRRFDGSVPPPWTKTDADGRFELTMLPDEPLSLMAYIPPKPPETRIRFPANVQPRLNQRDVRILLDPDLVSEE